MSISIRFFIKTKYPSDVEESLISTLGGSAWLYKDCQGNYLRRITILNEDDLSILPARDACRNLVYLGPSIAPLKEGHWEKLKQLVRSQVKAGGATPAVTDNGRWYWLDSMIPFNSDEAAQVAYQLLNSDRVEKLAEDNEITGSEDDSTATVIGPDHYMIQHAMTRLLTE